MKRILLCCAAGMSTSLLVTKIKKAADEQGIETVTLQIEGMECGCEGAMIDRKMKALAGVTSRIKRHGFF